MTTTSSVALVMIGCGKFSRWYHVPTLVADANVAFTGIFDPAPSPEVEDLARSTGAPLVAKLEALPATTGSTMAIVTTPHALHAEHVAYALGRGWHVLCDKPFVMRATDALFLAGEASRRKLVNAVAFNRRFDSG